ncbi:ElyC/SanA/YdcF family protein [Pseudoclavibacter sp. VKM Ac-2867]|uniref:ElyC/SanA/YdcF family protein n=1 Tax=Pseudoclavibacter sp. VKM Ac-2867 TaxID=2783829 RepID=UPI00188AB301|nr:ElyC/SanA/YdcF family protein [Pseudoclavibacter sp. VKM Ac-2867]MBF4457336.1 YdcF family protein [Pseudoclavibacter sp. VKM Ac-2867]
MKIDLGPGASPPAGAWRERRIWHLVLLALATLLMIPVGPVLFPPQRAPTTVDAIFVLGPASQTRIGLGQDLIAAGFSNTLVVSTTPGMGTYGADKLWICTHEQAYDVHCVQPQPSTTQGEVALLQRMADEQGWDSVMVITFAPHVLRTELYLDRCFTGESTVVQDGTYLGPKRNALEYLYQLLAFGKAFTLSTGCA